MARSELDLTLDAACCPPERRCNNPFLQDPMTRKWIMVQFFCALVNYFAEETVHDCTDADALKELGECYWCQGSVGKLELTQLQMVCEAFPLLNCDQPVCWSPLELEATLTRLVCELVTLIYNESQPN
jgi:hypothetical protein